MSIHESPEAPVLALKPEVAYLWGDLETTNLDIEGREGPAARILEVAIVGTDTELNEVFRYESPVQVDAVDLAAMPEVVAEMHRANGLYEIVASGAHLPTIEQVDMTICDLLDTHQVAQPLHLAGGGVAQFDIHAMRVNMPGVAARLHYRPLDVSILAFAHLRATGRDMHRPAAGHKTHRAMDDVLDDLDLGRRLFSFLRFAEEAQDRLAAAALAADAPA